MIEFKVKCSKLTLFKVKRNRNIACLLWNFFFELFGFVPKRFVPNQVALFPWVVLCSRCIIVLPCKDSTTGIMYKAILSMLTSNICCRAEHVKAVCLGFGLTANKLLQGLNGIKPQSILPRLFFVLVLFFFVPHQCGVEWLIVFKQSKPKEKQPHVLERCLQ